MTNRPMNWRDHPMGDVWTDIPTVAEQDRINAQKNKELITTLAVIARKFLNKPNIIEFVSLIGETKEEHIWTHDLKDACKMYYPVALPYCPKTTDPTKVVYALLDANKLKEHLEK